MNSDPNSNNSNSEICIELFHLYFYELPPFQLIANKNLTQEQSQIWKHRKNYWRLIGEYLDYLQIKQAGYPLRDPLDSYRLDKAIKNFISISARGYFAELNVMTASWDLIIAFAAENKREFPFESPSQMLAERCKRLSILQSEASLSAEINQGNTLGEVRDDWANYKRLIHGKLKASEVEKSVLPALLESNDWFDFVICAVWHHTTKREVRKAWNNFKDAFDEEAAMWQKKDYFKELDVRLASIKWHQGIPVDAQSSRRITFS